VRRTEEQHALEMRRALEDAREFAAPSFAAVADIGRSLIVAPRAVRIRDAALEWSNEKPGWDYRLPAGEPMTPGVPRFTVGQRDGKLVDRFVFGQRDAKLFDRFIRIYRAADEDIAAFATRYGVLFLSPSGDPNGLPTIEGYDEERLVDVRLGAQSNGMDPSDLDAFERPVRWHRESLAGWRAWSLFVRTLLLFCLVAHDTSGLIDPFIRLRDWKLTSYSPRDEDAGWYVAYHYRQFLEQLKANKTVEDQRFTLGDWLDFLVSHRAMAPRIRWWETDRPTMRLGNPRQEDFIPFQTHPVFGDVLTMTIARVLGAEKQNICECGTPYTCHSRRGYCPECRRERRNATKRGTWAKHGPTYEARRRAKT
jgi:hypothetical protein